MAYGLAGKFAGACLATSKDRSFLACTLFFFGVLVIFSGLKKQTKLHNTTIEITQSSSRNYSNATAMVALGMVNGGRTSIEVLHKVS